MIDHQQTYFIGSCRRPSLPGSASASATDVNSSRLRRRCPSSQYSCSVARHLLPWLISRPPRMLCRCFISSGAHACSWVHGERVINVLCHVLRRYHISLIPIGANGVI